MKPLAAQLYKLAVLAASVTVLTVVVMMWGAFAWLDRYTENQFSPATRAALASNQPLPPAIEAELVRVDRDATRVMYVLMSVAPLLGVALGGIVGWRYARRLAAPLGGVAEAARRLSAGELGARAPAGLSQVTELERFVQDFNRMAQALQTAERERQASSAAIAHELRTPLTILQGRLNGMLDGVFPLSLDGVRPLLEQVELLGRIVEDLRLLTLADAGRLALDCAPVNLAEQAAAVVAAMRPMVEAWGWQLHAELVPVTVLADGARVRQALQALLHNALRYGAGPITVQTEAADGTATLRVLDHGPGLPPGCEAQAFDRFWRADDSRGREGGGSGLGLSVVRAIAHAHRGTAFYAPRDGGGAVFGLTLPVDDLPTG